MNLLFDTNIILALLRAKNYSGIVNFLNPEDAPIYISVASEAEIKSIAIRNNWGVSRRKKLDNFLEQFIVVEINQLSIGPYIEIDSYSQHRNTTFPNYAFSTPRNMGKNDLWIASLGFLLGLQLVTTDADFDHLHSIFLDVRKISTEAFSGFF